MNEDQLRIIHTRDGHDFVPSVLDCPKCQAVAEEYALRFPDPDSMSSHALLVELVTGFRELRAVLDPILADPAQLLAGMGPMGAMAGFMLGKRPPS